MARSPAQVQRWLAEGRGQGHGTTYQPWLQVRDVMSVGRSHKIPGIKISRTHHLLSDLEAACLLVLEFQQNVIDIREQFPLLPTELSERAATSVSIRHPTYRGTAVPQVLTSDFCVDVQTEGVRVMETAIAVKYAQALRKRRVRELLAIEREANRLARRNWMLFTETSVPSTVVRNLCWLRHGTASRVPRIWRAHRPPRLRAPRPAAAVGVALLQGGLKPLRAPIGRRELLALVELSGVRLQCLLTPGDCQIIASDHGPTDTAFPARIQISPTRATC